MSNNKGLTLIEMIIVLAIMGIMAATAYPSLSGAKDMSNEDDRAKHEYVVNKALRVHYALTGTYPNQGVGVGKYDRSISELTSTELSILASGLAQQTGVSLNTAKYKYTYGLKKLDHEYTPTEPKIYDVRVISIPPN